jgi:hypothetical protein
VFSCEEGDMLISGMICDETGKTTRMRNDVASAAEFPEADWLFHLPPLYQLLYLSTAPRYMTVPQHMQLPASRDKGDSMNTALKTTAVLLPFTAAIAFLVNKQVPEPYLVGS